MIRTLLSTSLLLLAYAGAMAAETPHWIWKAKTSSDGEKVNFRKVIKIDSKVTDAKLIVTVDNSARIYVNGTDVGRVSEWNDPAAADVTKHLIVGDNVIAIEATNADGGAGMIARLSYKKGPASFDVVSDESWRNGTGNNWKEAKFDDSKWNTSVNLGKLGIAPWGDVFAGAGKPTKSNVTAVEDLQLPPGFKAELVYVVPKAEQGSWVSMTIDDKGRLITSDQGQAGIFRITPSPIGGDMETTKVEKLNLDAGSAQGLLYANNSLYISINGKFGKKGAGVYRATDSNGDGELDAVATIKELAGGGEHGPHALIKGPDGKIYFCAGNHTNIPDQFTTYLPPKVWAEDQVLPRHADPNGHARDRFAPGGYITRFDSEGNNWELISIGFRNQYDIAFNTAGELFSYDADMEWDLGSPWYRPTRACHVTSGSEFGWRNGSGKWPAYYADSLPGINDVGPGSPTGMGFGTNAKFPAKYQQAMYLLDWTYGTIYAVHTTPHGSSYSSTREDFVYGKPLPVTDMVIGNDGAMYFTIGGRGTQSAIYRVIYTGTESTAPAAPLVPNADIKLRRSLEAYHGKQDPAAVAAAIPYLGHVDRFIRFAARTALEHQPTASWQKQALAAPSALARITGILGLARTADKSQKETLFAALAAIDPVTLDQSTLLDYIRTVGLVGVRLGAADVTTAQQLATKLDGLYPSNDAFLNRELAGILSVLGSPMVVSKTIARLGAEEQAQNTEMKVLIDRNDRYGKTVSELVNSKPQQQGILYASALSVATNGWTPELRKQYFTWFIDAEANGKGGNSFKGFIRAIQKDAMSRVPAAEQANYTADKLTTGQAKTAPIIIPTPKGPGQNWTMDDVTPWVKNGLGKRNFANGKAMYLATQCTMCHRFAGEGAAVGPDITSVGTKFSPRDLLESIIEPSKVISDQYQNHAIVTKAGLTFIGKLMGEENGQVMIATSPFDLSQLTSVNKDDITTTMPMKVSIMPPAVINRLNKEEILDLLAYLISAGNDQDKIYK